MIGGFYDIINMGNAVNSTSFKNISCLVMCQTAAFNMI